MGPIDAQTPDLLSNSRCAASPERGGGRLTFGDGLLLVNEPVIGDRPRRRFIHRYWVLSDLVGGCCRCGSDHHHPTGTERPESGISTFLGSGGEDRDGAGLWDRGFIGSG